MPLPIPILDDRTFDLLVTEGRALIPRYFPDWTDYNASDPGIVLLELFAFLFEVAHYQLDRVPERSLVHFAGLVGVVREAGESIEALLARTLATLQQNNNAFTASQIDALVRNIVYEDTATNTTVIVQRTQIRIDAGRTIQLLVVPATDGHIVADATLGQKLCATIYTVLHPRCLLTTRLQVILPTYDEVNIVLTVARDSRTRVRESDLVTRITQAINQYIDPLTGGRDGNGWPFGRAIYRSELYQIIDDISGVDYVVQMSIKGSSQFSVGDIADPVALLAALTATNASNPVAFVQKRLFQEQTQSLAAVTRSASGPTTQTLAEVLVPALNQLLVVNPLLDDSTYTSFLNAQGVSGATQALKATAMTSGTLDDLMRYNRSLLEDIFPEELTSVPNQEDEVRDVLPLSPLYLPTLTNLQVTVVKEVAR